MCCVYCIQEVVLCNFVVCFVDYYGVQVQVVLCVGFWCCGQVDWQVGEGFVIVLLDCLLVLLVCFYFGQLWQVDCCLQVYYVVFEFVFQYLVVFVVGIVEVVLGVFVYVVQGQYVGLGDVFFVVVQDYVVFVGYYVFSDVEVEVVEIVECFGWLVVESGFDGVCVIFNDDQIVLLCDVYDVIYGVGLIGEVYWQDCLCVWGDCCFDGVRIDVLGDWIDICQYWCEFGMFDCIDCGVEGEWCGDYFCIGFDFGGDYVYVQCCCVGIYCGDVFGICLFVFGECFFEVGDLWFGI